jgi:predicted double-glycine peptidase
MEDIQNNAIYVVDPDTQQIRYAKDPDEYVTERLVFVYNPVIPTWDRPVALEMNHRIEKGTHCRCWIVCMQMV